GSAILWDTVTGAYRGGMVGHPGPVVAAAFHPSGKTLATGTLVPDKEKKQFVTGSVALWNAKTYQRYGQILPHPGAPKALAFSPDGRTLLTGCVVQAPEGPSHFKGEARLWDPETTEPLGPP